MKILNKYSFSKPFDNVWEGPNGNHYIGVFANDQISYLINVDTLMQYFLDFNADTLISDILTIIVKYVKQAVRPENTVGDCTTVNYECIEGVDYFLEMQKSSIERCSLLIDAYVKFIIER